jgi:hypothetical protein
MNPDEPQFEKFWRQRIATEIKEYYEQLDSGSSWIEGVFFGGLIAERIALKGADHGDR